MYAITIITRSLSLNPLQFLPLNTPPVVDSGSILTSTEGKTQTTRTSGTTNNLYSGTYGNSNFVVVGANGTLLTASDATTSSIWTTNRTYT